MTTKARHNNAPAIAYDVARDSYVPFEREDGELFTVAGCPSHPFYMMVRRAIDTSKNPAAVRSAVAGYHEQQYHGSIEYRCDAIVALAEYGAQPFWFTDKQDARAALEQRLLTRNASQVKEETYHVTNINSSNELGAAG